MLYLIAVVCGWMAGGFVGAVVAFAGVLAVAWVWFLVAEWRFARAFKAQMAGYAQGDLTRRC